MAKRSSLCRCSDRALVPGTLDFSASGHLYATHGLHPFAARLPPPLARWAIETFTDPGDDVLDVMCGSGTSLVEGLLTGRHARGVEIDPLSRLVSIAKATPIEPKAINDLARKVDRISSKYLLDDSWRPVLPRLEYWFREDVSADLARLKSIIVRATTSGSPLRDLAWAVFSSLIVARTSVANARDLVHSRHHYREWREKPDVLGRFVQCLLRAARMMQDLIDHMPEQPRIDAALAGTDARELSMADDAVDLSFFSPPYVSALDYPRAHVFAVAWLSDILATTVDEYRNLARRFIGTDRAALAEATAAQPLPPDTGWPAVDAVVQRLAPAPKKAWTVHRYFKDMATVIFQCARVTRPGGHIVIVVCPSNIRRVRVDTHHVFAELATLVSNGGLKVENIYERTIHDHRRVMPYMEQSFGERMRTEYVVVAHRTARKVATNGHCLLDQP